MPALANMVVKKFDNTTDVTYTGVVASGGDNSPAVWRNTAVGSAVAFNPMLTVRSKNNGTGSARRVDLNYVYPSVVVGSDGTSKIANKFIFDGSVLVPLGMTNADVSEGAYQLGNLMFQTLVKEIMRTGYAAT